MKLAPIKREHVISAGEHINSQGIESGFIYNNYWVELPNGREYPFKYLTRLAYRYTPGNEDALLDFESNEGYRGYLEHTLKFPIHYYEEGVNFISKEDIEYFENVGGKPYRKTNEEDVRAAQLIKPLVYKVNVWAKRSLIENFTYRKDNYWQWSGTFRPYLWIRIFREDSSQKVFFVLGATSNGGLFYKLDCLRSNYTNSGVLPLEKQNQFDEYLSRTDYKEGYISKESLGNLDWNELTEQTTRFFYQNSALYDELEDLINSSVEDSTSSILEPVAPPKKTKSYVNKKRTFNGVVTDWSQKQATTKSLGDAGENLVIKFEKAKLDKAGLTEKSKLVDKVLDGRGFDILSFNLSGEEINIEVKTTTGKKDEPFYFSINEKEYLEQHPDKYILYRLHEFKINPDRAKFFVLTANELIQRADFNPTNFEVSIKEVIDDL